MLRKKNLLFLLFLFLFHRASVTASNDTVGCPGSFRLSGVQSLFLGSIGLVVMIECVKLILRATESSQVSTTSCMELMEYKEQDFHGEINSAFKDLINVLTKITVIDRAKKSSFKLFNILFKFFNIKEQVIDPNFKKALPLGYLLYGPPGCGKNVSIQKMVNQLKENKATADIPILSFSGEIETGVIAGGSRKWFLIQKQAIELAKKSQKKTAIVVFNECENIFAQRVGDSRFDRGSLPTILESIDGTTSPQEVHIVIIGVTNHLQSIDPAVVSRLSSVQLTQSAENMKNIVQAKLSKIGCSELTFLTDAIGQGCLYSDVPISEQNKGVFQMLSQKNILVKLKIKDVAAQSDMLPLRDVSIRDVQNIERQLYQSWISNLKDSEMLDFAQFKKYENKKELFDKYYELLSTNPPVLCPKRHISN